MSRGNWHMRSMVAVAIVGATTLCSPAYAGSRTKAPPLELPHCVRPIGTVAVVEPKVEAGLQPWWTANGLGSPETVLKVYIQQSNCFTLVDRGRGMETAERERALAAAGVLRPRSNIGKGQVRAADFVIVPDLLSGNSNANGSVVTGILGSVVGGQFGALLGGLSFNGKTADVVLTVMDVRTSESDIVVQGHAKKTDIGWAAGGGTIGSTGMGVLAGGGYTNTELGQVIMTAYLDAYIKLVNQLGGLTQGDPAAEAPKMALTVASSVNLREGPSTREKVLRSLSPGALLYPTGSEAQGWVEVEDEMGFKGWVLKTLLQPAR